jgi:hypothetical protein
MQNPSALTPIRVALMLALIVSLLVAGWFAVRPKPAPIAPRDASSEVLQQPQPGDLWLASAVPLSQGRAAGRTRYLLYRVEAINAAVVKVVMHKSQFDAPPIGDWQSMGLTASDFETSDQFDFSRPELANQLLVQNDRDRVLRRLVMIKRGNQVITQAP